MPDRSRYNELGELIFNPCAEYVLVVYELTSRTETSYAKAPGGPQCGPNPSAWTNV
jgi:hypothetical protein